ncbi:MAG: helix-turn-helix domain-containing protein [Alphaproteobacteria bacterium]|nr:helix-turn-helix domain-containing protein [Alphaproteobacteria bacterium]
MSMPAQSKYNSKYHDAWAWSLAVKGATDEEIADAFGISRMTLSRWVKDDDKKSLAEAIANGKPAADANVERKLYDRCMGYEVTEATQILEHDFTTGKPVIKETRTTKKHIAPDIMAIMYWLNNRSRKTGEWSQKQEVSITGLENMPDMSGLSEEELRAIARMGSGDET